MPKKNLEKLNVKFITKVYEEIVNANIAFYSKAYNDISINDNLTDEMKNKIAFVQSLDPEQKKVFVSHMKQVAIDTLSNVFGIIDGSSYLEGFNEGDFELKYGSHIKQILSGDLQDMFLEHVEERNKMSE